MSTVFIIVGGIVIISVLGIVADTVQTIAKAKSRRAEAPGPAPRNVAELEARIAALESRLEERDRSLLEMRDELRFVTRMLEDKSAGRS